MIRTSANVAWARNVHGMDASRRGFLANAGPITASPMLTKGYVEATAITVLIRRIARAGAERGTRPDARYPSLSSTPFARLLRSDGSLSRFGVAGRARELAAGSSAEADQSAAAEMTSRLSVRTRGVGEKLPHVVLSR